jgi:hypothetical protein
MALSILMAGLSPPLPVYLLPLADPINPNAGTTSGISENLAFSPVVPVARLSAIDRLARWQTQGWTGFHGG